MNWNDWEAVWKRQEPPIGAAADIGDLRRTFEAKRRKLSRTLLARDASEAAAGVLVSAFLAWSWWKMGREGWPIGIAIALTLGVSAFFCYERVRAHRGRLGPDAPVIAKLDDEISELRHQRRLLHGVATWYLAPIGASWLIVVVTAGRAAARHAPPGFFAGLMGNPVTAGFIILYFLVVTPLCFWGAWFLNRRAVLRGIDPRIEELEKLRRDMEPSR